MRKLMLAVVVAIAAGWPLAMGIAAAVPSLATQFLIAVGLVVVGGGGLAVVAWRVIGR